MKFINKKQKNEVEKEKTKQEDVSPMGQNVPNRNVPNWTLYLYTNCMSDTRNTFALLRTC